MTKIINCLALRELRMLKVTEKPLSSLLYQNEYQWALNDNRVLYLGFMVKKTCYGGVPQKILTKRTCAETLA